MDGIGDQLLARARLAADQHRGIPFGHLPDLLEDDAHLVGMPDDVGKAMLGLDLLAQIVALLAQGPLFGRHPPGELHGLADEIGHHLQEAGMAW